MGTKGEGISRDQAMIKGLGENIEPLEDLPQQTDVESSLADNRKFIPKKKKRGGCTNSGSSSVSILEAPIKKRNGAMAKVGYREKYQKPERDGESGTKQGQKPERDGTGD